MKHRDRIIAYFDNIPVGYVVSANEIYEKHFLKMSQNAFFKALERLAKDGYLTRISKGMYARKDKSQEIQEQQNGEEQNQKQQNGEEQNSIMNYYFGENNDNGMYIGYRLYQKYSITNAKSDQIELYSNAITRQTSNVGNIHVKRVNLELNFENTRIIEALEILQNYDKIEDLNKLKFARYARAFARGYNDEAAVHVISHMKYKKNTIAFMRKILDMYKVKNSLSQFLSYASRYKVPPVQRVAR